MKIDLASSIIIQLVRTLTKTNASSWNAMVGQAPHFSLGKSLGN